VSFLGRLAADGIFDHHMSFEGPAMPTQASRENPSSVPSACSGNIVASSERVPYLLTALQAAFVLAIWLLSRGYNGISNDSLIYIGRAMADLDPQGIGRDALFTFDGQTKYTAYTLLARPLVHLLGPSVATMGLTVGTLLLWIVAAAYLASRLMTRRLVPTALICAALLPATYGPFNVFSFGEALATPRGLAEAACLAAIAAALDDRRYAAVGFLLVAILLHIPTAMIGLGVVLLLHFRKTPLILLLLAACAGMAVSGAGLLHLGPAADLFQFYDPAWLAAVKIRNPFLFESMWPANAWSHAVVSCTTLLVAARLMSGPRRVVLISTVALASIGVIFAYVLGDLTADLLILRLQLWRGLWLCTVLAALLVPFCAVELWTSARRERRLVLVLLACAWIGIDNLMLAVSVGLISIGVLILYKAPGPDRAIRISIVAVAFTAFSLLIADAASDYAFSAQLTTALRAAGVPSFPLDLLIPVWIHSGLLVLAVVAAFTMSSRASPTVRLVTLSVLVALTLPFSLLSWDRRSPARQAMELAEGRTELAAFTGAAPNGVVWLDNSLAPWLWIGRSTWLNVMQGTTGAFSRRLALQWDVRSTLLVSSGLGTPFDRDPVTRGRAMTVRDTDVEGKGIVQLCRAPDGPSAVIAPGDLTQKLTAGQVALWQAPVPAVLPIVEPTGQIGFSLVDRYTVVRCTPELRVNMAAAG
jgi:hypothetical protein